MVADGFFELRPRLGAALFPLGRLAEAAGLRPGRGPVIRELTEQLRDPIVFVVAGEVNSGKSSLLNALFGEEFCATGVLPETQRIHFFRYAKKPERSAASGTLEEIGLPHAFLRESGVAGHCQELTRRRRLVRRATVGGLALGTATLAAGLSGLLPWDGALLTALGGFGVMGWQVGRRMAPPAAGPAEISLAEAGRFLEQETLALAQEHGTRRLTDFSPLLTPLQEAIHSRKTSLIPLQAETAQLALTLQNLARALHPDWSGSSPPDRP